MVALYIVVLLFKSSLGGRQRFHAKQLSHRVLVTGVKKFPYMRISASKGQGVLEHATGRITQGGMNLQLFLQIRIKFEYSENQ